MDLLFIYIFWGVQNPTTPWHCGVWGFLIDSEGKDTRNCMEEHLKKKTIMEKLCQSHGKSMELFF